MTILPAGTSPIVMAKKTLWVILGPLAASAVCEKSTKLTPSRTVADTKTRLKLNIVDGCTRGTRDFYSMVLTRERVCAWERECDVRGYEDGIRGGIDSMGEAEKARIANYHS